MLVVCAGDHGPRAGRAGGHAETAAHAGGEVHGGLAVWTNGVRAEHAAVDALAAGGTAFAPGGVHRHDFRAGQHLVPASEQVRFHRHTDGVVTVADDEGPPAVAVAVHDGVDETVFVELADHLLRFFRGLDDVVRFADRRMLHGRVQVRRVEERHVLPHGLGIRVGRGLTDALGDCHTRAVVVRLRTVDEVDEPAHRVRRTDHFARQRFRRGQLVVQLRAHRVVVHEVRHFQDGGLHCAVDPLLDVMVPIYRLQRRARRVHDEPLAVLFVHRYFHSMPPLKNRISFPLPL